ncbi:SagB family peptide dehydrogenase [Microbispora sp. NPDC046933]|uniref:SagB family peptide dehydrogenase n=1 Tax=Microbispora sp. NPDC046933 TaxID=3155618 RepID=UPI00340E8782
MGNWDRDAGARYMRATLYDARDLFTEVLSEKGTGHTPSPFKVYRDVPRFELGRSLPLRLGDARWSFEEFRREAAGGGPGEPVFDAGLLSALLYYTYGFSRRDVGPGAVWPFHRFVPSARCLFPTELYVWIPRTGALPPGIYHYDSLHHQVELLREGDHREELSHVLGADLDGARCVLLFSSLFWKNAYKYHAYSYRLCSQEAGMTVGNALMVGGALGLRGHVHYQFLDERAGGLLGLDLAEENLFAAVPLYPWEGRDEVRPEPGNPPPGPLTSISPPYARTEGFEHVHGELFSSIAGNCLLRGVSEFGRRGPEPDACPEPSALRPPSPPTARGTDLAEALRSRCSGNVLFNPVSAPLATEEFWEIVRYAMSPVVADLGTAPGLRLYVVVLDVADVPAGVYRYCTAHEGLHLVGSGDVSLPLQGAIAVPNLNLCASNMVLYVAGDHPAASRAFGNRAYRILNMEAGLVAQRICVMSGAYGLAARIHNGYDAATVERVLGIEESGLTPLFQVAVAHNRPGVQYGLPILF